MLLRSCPYSEYRPRPHVLHGLQETLQYPDRDFLEVQPSYAFVVLVPNSCGNTRTCSVRIIGIKPKRARGRWSLLCALEDSRQHLWGFSRVPRPGQWGLVQRYSCKQYSSEILREFGILRQRPFRTGILIKNRCKDWSSSRAKTEPPEIDTNQSTQDGSSESRRRGAQGKHPLNMIMAGSGCLSKSKRAGLCS